MIQKYLIPPLFGLVLISAGGARAADSPKGTFDLNLEELMQVVVTSVSKKAQTLAQTAAAAYVIQAEDIRRSGATRIPEALRLAPGVQVSAIGHNKWAVSIRGQADRFSNKLLVLVDGRSVYTPLFSGVMWEALDVPLENIERIEVRRGPGASIRGANAVNGVINIITTSPFQRPGSEIALAAGSELTRYGLVRQAWQPGVDTALRFHVQAWDYDASRPIGGGDGVDDEQHRSAGFRLEHLLKQGMLNVRGGLAESRAGDQLTMLSAPPAITQVETTQKISGGHLMVRWERECDECQGEGYGESLQAYLDHQNYEHIVLTDHRSNFDLEYQQSRALSPRQDVIWGLGYRYSGDRIDNSPQIAVYQRERDTHLWSAYLQDQITLEPARWRLSLGARLEHNDYTGHELQPNLRLLWTPNPRNSAWLSLARAIRTPARFERGGALNFQVDPVGTPPLLPPSVLQVTIDQIQEERLDALDLGWRHQIGADTSIDLTAFHYRYNHLRGAATTTPTLVLPANYLLIQTEGNNANHGTAYGLEAALDWRPRPNWRLQAHYSWLQTRMETADIPGQLPNDYANSSPTHLFSLRSSLDLSEQLQWDAWLRHVSTIKSHNIPAYTTLDLRLAWKPRKDLTVSLVGQNLLDNAHPEYGSGFIRSTPSEIQRGLYAKAEWTY